MRADVPALWTALFRDLGRLRAQVATLSLVVAAGTAVFVSMKLTVDVLDAARAEYFRAQRFADVFASAKRVPRAVLGDLRAIPGVAQAEGRIVGDAPMYLPGRSQPATVHMVSIDHRIGAPLDAIRLREGRMPDPEHDDEIVLNEPFSQATHVGPGDSVRAVLYGRMRTLRVVGVGIAPDLVFQMPSGVIAPNDERYGAAWMLREPMEAAFDLGGAFNDLLIRLGPGAVRGDVLQAIDRRLAAYGGHDAYLRADQLSFKMLDSRLERIRAMLVMIPALFLLVAAFVLNVVLGRLVQSQREQIGMLKAFGYTDGRLARHYLAMATFAIAPGVLVGVVGGMEMGHGLIALYLRYFRLPLTETGVSWAIVAQAVSVAFVAAALGALRAARAVARLRPVEAMRPPTPPVYRKGLVERLGLGRKIPAWILMIARNLRLQPLRAAASVTALAFATALCVTSSFFGGSIDALVRHQFNQAMRADLTVGLVRPLDPEACSGLLALDGVTACEPIAVWPVRVRFGPAYRQLALTALPDGTRLRRLVDTTGRIVAPPVDGGLLVSRRLLQRLGASVGDLVTVETVEGRPRSLMLPVRAAIEDEMGLNVYASPRTLTDLLGETPPMSQALLSAPVDRHDDITTRLGTVPGVIGVISNKAQVADFEKATASSMRVMNFILAFLAGALAVAVVYNGARVALSERARDLASLRVLGFTRGEVSRILLGEKALELMAAVPLGLVLGRFLAAASLRGMAADEVRLPLVITTGTYGLAAAVVLGAAILSALQLRRLIDRLDLVEVLKTRE
jgi:putative ABC transport system permease protein